MNTLRLSVLAVMLVAISSGAKQEKLDGGGPGCTISPTQPQCG
jgi:hypothetical protein